ncbi:hypothetical protein VQH23_12220 [Pararoseomonas sp. SCSIO 73927]|uniref:hypothetical protein n=1 Tax=Pararoseomonas sp. SCSIO 73927 TaxID=3114537 RepID=UPI0030D5FEB7
MAQLASAQAVELCTHEGTRLVLLDEDGEPLKPVQADDCCTLCQGPLATTSSVTPGLARPVGYILVTALFGTEGFPTSPPRAPCLRVTPELRGAKATPLAGWALTSRMEGGVTVQGEHGTAHVPREVSWQSGSLQDNQCQTFVTLVRTPAEPGAHVIEDDYGGEYRFDIAPVSRQSSGSSALPPSSILS